MKSTDIVLTIYVDLLVYMSAMGLLQSHRTVSLTSHFLSLMISGKNLLISSRVNSAGGDLFSQKLISHIAQKLKS